MWVQRMTTEVILTIFGKLQLTAAWESEIWLIHWVQSLCPEPWTSDVTKEGKFWGHAVSGTLGELLNILEP